MQLVLPFNNIPGRTKDKISQNDYIIHNGKQIIYSIFKSEFVPQNIKLGGGGMISKVVDEVANQRIIMALPEKEEYQKYFKYSVLHEYFDSKTEEKISMREIEELVLDEYLKDYPEGNRNSIGEDEDLVQYVLSRIAFFQGQLKENGDTNISHNTQIQETIDYLNTL